MILANNGKGLTGTVVDRIPLMVTAESIVAENPLPLSTPTVSNASSRGRGGRGRARGRGKGRGKAATRAAEAP